MFYKLLFSGKIANGAPALPNRPSRDLGEVLSRWSRFENSCNERLGCSGRTAIGGEVRLVACNSFKAALAADISTSNWTLIRSF